MNNQSIEKAELTVGQVLTRINRKSRNTLWLWIRNGEFPEPVIAGKKGARIYWRESDVEAWAAKRQWR